MGRDPLPSPNRPSGKRAEIRCTFNTNLPGNLRGAAQSGRARFRVCQQRWTLELSARPRCTARSRTASRPPGAIADGTVSCSTHFQAGSTIYITYARPFIVQHARRPACARDRSSLEGAYVSAPQEDAAHPPRARSALLRRVPRPRTSTGRFAGSRCARPPRTPPGWGGGVDAARA